MDYLAHNVSFQSIMLIVMSSSFLVRLLMRNVTAIPIINPSTNIPIAVPTNGPENGNHNVIQFSCP